MQYVLRRSDYSVEEDPTNNGDNEVGSNFSPEHINVCTSQWISVSSCLLPRFPNSKKTKAKGKPHGHGGDLDVAR